MKWRKRVGKRKGGERQSVSLCSTKVQCKGQGVHLSASELEQICGEMQKAVLCTEKRSMVGNILFWLIALLSDKSRDEML